MLNDCRWSEKQKSIALIGKTMVNWYSMKLLNHQKPENPQDYPSKGWHPGCQCSRWSRSHPSSPCCQESRFGNDQDAVGCQQLQSQHQRQPSWPDTSPHVSRWGRGDALPARWTKWPKHQVQVSSRGHWSTGWVTGVDSRSLSLLDWITDHSDVNVQNKEGETGLMIALERNNLEIADLLLAKGSDLFLLNKFRETALHIACRKNQVEMIKKMLTFKVCPAPDPGFVRELSASPHFGQGIRGGGWPLDPQRRESHQHDQLYGWNTSASGCRGWISWHCWGNALMGPMTP